jgi:thiaminase/transcriptional activator TenA
MISQVNTNKSTSTHTMTFSSDLRARHLETWTSSTTHAFVSDLWSGTIPDAAMRTYLAQDSLFVDAFIALLGSAVSNATSPGARITLARQVGLVANDEDAYFVRALNRLAPGEAPADPLPPTKDFIDLMLAARADYASALTVLLVAEWLYLEWATPIPTPPTPEDWLHVEWIELHRGEAFEAWVAFLKTELDAVAARADEKAKERIEGLFARAVQLELQFFDATYPQRG